MNLNKCNCGGTNFLRSELLSTILNWVLGILIISWVISAVALAIELFKELQVLG